MDLNQLLGAYKRDVYKRPYGEVVTWARNYLWRGIKDRHVRLALPCTNHELYFGELGAAIDARETKSPLWVIAPKVKFPLLSVRSMAYFSPDDPSLTGELDPAGGLEASIKRDAGVLRKRRRFRP